MPVRCDNLACNCGRMVDRNGSCEGTIGVACNPHTDLQIVNNNHIMNQARVSGSCLCSGIGLRELPNGLGQINSLMHFNRGCMAVCPEVNNNHTINVVLPDSLGRLLSGRTVRPSPNITIDDTSPNKNRVDLSGRVSPNRGDLPLSGDQRRISGGGQGEYSNDHSWWDSRSYYNRWNSYTGYHNWSGGHGGNNSEWVSNNSWCNDSHAYGWQGQSSGYQN